jgi:hypothetical protein
VGYPVAVTFYLTLILIGALFAINLLTAILSAKVQLANSHAEVKLPPLFVGLLSCLSNTVWKGKILWSLSE